MRLVLRMSDGINGEVEFYAGVPEIKYFLLERRVEADRVSDGATRLGGGSTYWYVFTINAASDLLRESRQTLQQSHNSQLTTVRVACRLNIRFSFSR